MITDEVIREIYKNHKKPPKDFSELNLAENLYILKKHHNLTLDSDDLQTAEIIINDLEDFNPFRRFLVRSLHAILEFDRMVAFVFRNHILFLGKEDNQLRVHFKPEDDEDDDDENDSFLSRLFGRRKRH
ncbi:MAG: hypothetical protein K2M31_06740 [Muribaculaceae bacterium]|nr:hypothetical protein [Muribaculaceae bacterium]